MGRLPPSLQKVGGAAPPPPHTHTHVFADGIFLQANARHSKPKVASRCRHAANIKFNLFNIFLYVIARKVRKCPLSSFVTSNVVLSCLVRMADILVRLAQKADSQSALQLTGALWYSLSNTPNPPPFIPTPSLRPPPPPLFGPLRRPCRPVPFSCCWVLVLDYMAVSKVLKRVQQ